MKNTSKNDVPPLVSNILINLNAIGAEHAISKKALSIFTGMNERDLRRQIEAERNVNHARIMSNWKEGGYYIANRSSEVLQFILPLRKTCETQIKLLNVAEGMLSDMLNEERNSDLLESEATKWK